MTELQRGSYAEEHEDSFPKRESTTMRLFPALERIRRKVIYLAGYAYRRFCFPIIGVRMVTI